MTELEYKQSIFEILSDLRGLNPLKELFWGELNYDRVNESLSRHGWSKIATEALTEDPVLFATGGQDDGFHIIYSRLASDRLLLGHERPVVSRLLKDHPYVLFVFSNETQDRWHFLNVKYDEESEKRRLFRRITIGPEERLLTATERLSLLDIENFDKTLFDLSPLAIQQVHDESFDVEAVHKAFFSKYAELYHKVAADISKDNGKKHEAGKLAQLLLDRMLFLYFIQKKGWLNKKLNYLYALFKEHWRKDPKGYSYYSDALYPLFLSLSDPDIQIGSVWSVPFLNGGLCEESLEFSQANLKVKNPTFKAIFDDLLERFNFTVTEDTPLDVEVAIDPEMLGKIFESLILQLEKDPDKDLRKLTGSYYTPRPIVHFMCQEALKEYIVKQLSGNNTTKPLSVKEKVSKLLGMPPADQLDDENIGLLTDIFTVAEAKTTRQAILDCRVCDPAVGSGAFPVGMLHEMVGAIMRLDRRLYGGDILKQRNYSYELKKQVIESCLYGVDIQEQAVRLCELRLWLSLVVDYDIDPNIPFTDAINQIPSLPNLSYRIMRGDSLLERLFGQIVRLDEMARDARTKQIIESIQADKQTYFREDQNAEKQRLVMKILSKQSDLAERMIEAKCSAMSSYQQNIWGERAMSAKERKAKAEYETQISELNNLKRQVASAKKEIKRLGKQKGEVNVGDLDELRRQYFHTGKHPTFIWHLDFAEVFAEKNGFDVVIGNPPYNVANKFEAKPMKSDTEAMKRDPWLIHAFGGVLNLYRIFILRGISLLRPSGCLSIIVQCAVLSDKTASRLREFLFNNTRLIRIDAFPERDNERIRLFESAKMSTAILILQNCKDDTPFEVRSHYAREILPTVPVGVMTKYIVTQINPDTYEIPLIKEEEIEIFISAMRHPKIKGFTKCYTGEIDLTLQRPFITDNPSHMRMVKGAEVQRYYFAEKMSQGQFEYVNNRQYIKATKGKKSKHHKATRIVMQGITGVNESVRLKMTLLHPPAFCGNSVNYILADDLACDPKYLLGVLNSSLLNWLFKKQSTNSNVNGYEIDRLPIVVPDRSQQKAVTKLMDQIILQKNDTRRFAELDKQINKIVYRIYGLNSNQIAIVEGKK